MSRRQRSKRSKRRRAAARKPSRARLAAAGGLTLGAGLAAASPAQAVDFTVDVGGDAGDSTCSPASCTLRDALDDAGANATSDRILFSANITGTIALTSGVLPTIDDGLEILGPGAGTLTVDGLDADQILHISPGSGDAITVSGLTLADGHASTSGGGAIERVGGQGTLTIANSVITGNRTSGISNYGGGIWNYGPLAITNSTISGNSTGASDASGGGIFTYFGDATITNSTISGNSVVGTNAYGGGLAASGSYAYTTTITNSTISGNSATGSFGKGGGIHSDGAGLTLESSTVTGNSAPGLTEAQGGGIFTGDQDTDPVLNNTILANNSAGVAGNDAFSNYDTFQLGFSLVESTGGMPFAETVTGSNILGVDPGLGPLAANGGSTRTHALTASSPAVDKGSATGADQRGLPRPIDQAATTNSAAAGANAADIGAFELQPQPVAVTTSALPAPSEGRTANIFPLRGRVFVKPPSGRKHRLRAGEQVPIGAKVYARNGRVRVVTEYNGQLQSMVFFRGNFKIAQRRSGKPVVTVSLIGRPLKCGKSNKAATRSADEGELAESSRRRRRSGRRLWGKGRGRWRSKGRRGAGSVRGTKWLTHDRCTGKTLFRLRKGKLAINDFSKRGKVDKVLKGRGRYFAG